MCSEIIVIAHEIGGESFEDMQSEDIEQLITERLLDEEDFIKITTNVNSNNNLNNKEEDEKELTTAMIREILQFSTNMEQHFLNHDPKI